MNPQPLIDALLVIGINALAAALLIGVALGWKYLKTQQDMATVVAMVEAAEQGMGKATGPVRKRWVLQQARQYVPQLDVGLVEILIEAAVFEMNEGRE